MKTQVVTATLLLMLGLAAPSAFGQVDVIQDQLVDDSERTKLGQTGMQFLSVSLDPRASALGNAVTAVELNSTAQLYNPASLAFMEPTADISIGQNQWITDIKYMYGTAAVRAGNIGTIGINVLSVDQGQVQQTVRSESSEKGYLDVGIIEPSALAAGLSYARALTDRFAVGGNIRYVRQDLGSAWLSFGDPEGGVAPNQTQLEKGTAVVDFGVLYRTGFRSLNFAVNVRNFAGEIQYAEQSVELPLNFRIGLSMDMIDFAPRYQETHSFMLSVDATHPRAYNEQVKVGGEYIFMNTLALRAGYTYPTDEESVNLGAGLRLPVGDSTFGFDYSYTNFGIFDTVHRLGVQLTFD
jgi:hypothetical protein